MDEFTRTFTPELEIRSAAQGGDGRTIVGIAVPFARPQRIDARLVEQFSRGAFNHQLNAPGRVKFAREHIALGGQLIGAATVLRDDAAGLYVEMRASKTPVGDETLELIRDGALDELSIGFRERQNRKLAGGIVERVKADLLEVASVLEGAYGQLATAAGVRSAQTPVRPEDLLFEDKVEAFLAAGALPDLPDYDLEIRALNLGLKL